MCENFTLTFHPVQYKIVLKETHSKLIGIVGKQNNLKNPKGDAYEKHLQSEENTNVYLIWGQAVLLYVIACQNPKSN